MTYITRHLKFDCIDNCLIFTIGKDKVTIQLKDASQINKLVTWVKQILNKPFSKQEQQQFVIKIGSYKVSLTQIEFYNDKIYYNFCFESTSKYPISYFMNLNSDRINEIIDILKEGK